MGVRHDGGPASRRVLAPRLGASAGPDRAKGGGDQRLAAPGIELAHFPAGGNAAVIFGPRSGELVDIDLDCGEAVDLADLYLPPTKAEFGRASRPRSHRLYVSPGAVFEAFSFDGETLVELRARGATGGEHLTLIPPSVADWRAPRMARRHNRPGSLCGCAAAPPLRVLATAALVARHVSRTAAERPAPDLPRLLWEADPALGRVAFRWFGEPDPDAPSRSPKPWRDQTRAEIDLAEVVHAIPNNEDWHGCNCIGLAIYGASQGSNQGGIVFDDWSAKSPEV